MPLNFFGNVLIEEILSSQSGKEGEVKAAIKVEMASKFSERLIMSVWVGSNEKNTCLPLIGSIYFVEGKFGVNNDGYVIEVTRMFLASNIIMVQPPALCGTACFDGLVTHGEFRLKTAVYAKRAAGIINLLCQHSSKQYSKVESTIKMNQEIHLYGILFDLDANQITMECCQYSYLTKMNKTEEQPAVNAVKLADSNVETNLFSPSKSKGESPKTSIKEEEFEDIKSLTAGDKPASEINGKKGKELIKGNKKKNIEQSRTLLKKRKINSVDEDNFEFVENIKVTNDDKPL